MAEAFLGRALVLKKLARLEDALAKASIRPLNSRATLPRCTRRGPASFGQLGREDDAHAADARAAELEANKREASETQPSQS